jgi:ABC-type branched-subunit amino acid transport system ATPase component
MSALARPTADRLEVRQLTKRFRGVHALDDVSFSVRPGELVGLIGPNGSGKSTALDCICALQRPDAGEVRLDGQPLAARGPHRLARSGIARTFQDARVFDALTVAENLGLASMGATPGRRRWSTLLGPWSRTRAVTLHDMTRLLDGLGLGGLASRRAGELSYGQRKLVDLAAAAIQRPRLLLLDEPVAAVSPVIIETITDLLRRLHHEGVAILLVEHNLELVQDLCDRVVVLDSGRLIADGDPRDVIQRKEVHAAYFGV